MSSDENFRPNYNTCDEVSAKCPVEATLYQDYLSIPANAIFGICFAACFIVTVFFGLRGRMWSFTIWMGIGVGFEVIGYVARIRENKNPWSINTFIVEYCTLLLAPTLIAAAISITFKHLVLYYGPKWSVFRPSLYPWIFVGTDFLSIFIQIIGAGATSVATTGSSDNETIAKLGEGLVMGGVAFQVANMLVCSFLMLLYAKRRRNALRSGYQQTSQESVLHDPGVSQAYNNGYGGYPQQPPAYDSGYGAPQAPMQFGKGANFEKETKRAKIFVWALMVAYPAIIIRCCYRLAENVKDIRLDVLKNQPLFHVFDSTMILICVALMTVFHPFNFFPALKPRNGRGQYQDYPMS